MTWKYFTEKELACKHTGRCAMDPEFMKKLDLLRELFGGPLTVTSGFRDRSHPEERGKVVPGAHAQGVAVDLAVSGKDAIRVLELAIGIGFTGIGVAQKGAGRYIHLDTAPSRPEAPRPNIWSY